MVRKVGIALLGVGWPSKGALNRLQRLAMNSRVQIQWVVDRDAPLAAELVKQMKTSGAEPQVIKPCSIDDVYKDPNVDAILVGGPNLVVNTIRKALSFGKGVLCDRPTLLDSGSVLACYKQAVEMGRPLMFSFGRRFDPTLRQIRRELQSGHLGQVKEINVSSTYSPLPQLDHVRLTGIRKAQLGEDMDTVAWLTGAVPQSISVHGQTNLEETEQTGSIEAATVQLSLSGGITANITTTRSTDTCQESYQIHTNTTQLQAEFSDSRDIISRQNKNDSVSKTSNASIGQRHESRFIAAVDEFVNFMEGQGDWRQPMEDVLNSSYLLEACEKSLQSSGERVLLHNYTQHDSAREALQTPQWSEKEDIIQYLLK